MSYTAARTLSSLSLLLPPLYLHRELQGVALYTDEVLALAVHPDLFHESPVVFGLAVNEAAIAPDPQGAVWVVVEPLEEFLEFVRVKRYLYPVLATIPLTGVPSVWWDGRSHLSPAACRVNTVPGSYLRGSGLLLSS